MTHEQLLKKLQQLIAEKGTQSETARHLGITPSYLSDILSGKRSPGKKVLVRLGLESRTIYTPTQEVA